MNKRIIHTVFEQQALRVPNNIAVAEETQQVTYRELNSQANQLAHLLREKGVGKEEVVSVLLPAGIQLATSLLAVFKSGGVYLPMDPAFSRKRLLQMFTQTATRVLITCRALQETAQTLIRELELDIPHLLVMEDLPYENYSAENPALINEPGDSNYIFYTSGSTGAAKAFLGCHDSLSHFIHWELKEFGVNETFKVSQLSQITFDASLRDVLLPLSCGGTLCVPLPETRSNVITLMAWLEAQHVTLVHCVPSLWRLMSKELAAQDATAVRLPELKHILMAGEPLYGKDLQLWFSTAAQHVEIVNLYGTSETTLAKTFYRIKEAPADASQVMHVGQPISNTAVMILHQGQLCETGKIGEVYIRTPFMTKGYYKDPALTASVFIQNPFVKDRKELMHKTGDMGKYLPDGNIEILGRLDEQVKVNGIRVELNEIKQAVLGMPGMQEVVVMAHKNNDHQNELVCYYIASGVTVTELRTYLEAELNENVIPAWFVPMTEFPLTINGKVDKRALPKPEALVLDPADYEPVQGETEQQLETIWRSILGLNNIGRKANFFKAGGTSLKAMQVISRIYQQFEVGVKLSDMFARPDIRQMAAFIESASTSAYQAIPVAPQQTYYPVTPAQKGLWIQDQFGSQPALYNMPAAFILEGKLDKAALQKAITILVIRHESLRTTFVSSGGTVQQKIHAVMEVPLSTTDLQSAKDPLEAAKKIAMQAMAMPFDLQQGPLIRTQLLQLAKDRFIFLFNTHHIISDGWSEEILVKELFTLYAAYSKQLANPLPPLAIQYKDYAAWLNTQLSDAVLQEQAQYWQQQFTGELPLLQFPTDYPRPAERTTNGDVYTFSIPAGITAQLQACAQQEGASLFMALVAAVKALLNRFTGQEDMIIGAPIAGRTHKDVEPLVGLFVNMLALRTQFSSTLTFRQLLHKVKQTVTNAYAHQHYPFDELVRTLNLEFDNRRAPLTDVWVQLTDAPMTFDDKSDLQVTEYNPGYLTSKVDLTFKFTAFDDRLQVILEYNTDLFRRETMEQLETHFNYVLQQLLDNPSLPLSAVTLLTSGEEAAEADDFLNSMYNLS